MRTNRIDGLREPVSSQREPCGAPSLAFELAFVLSSLAAGLLLYSRFGILEAIVAWLHR